MSSHCETSKGPRGQVVKRAFGRDDSSHPVNEKEARNGKAGGSPTNLSHSLSGASAVQHASGGKGGK